MVADEVYHTLIATSLAVVLSTSKSFFSSHHLFNEDGKGPMELFKGEKTKSNFVKVTSFVFFWHT
jgi:hypothetical protein